MGWGGGLGPVDQILSNHTYVILMKQIKLMNLSVKLLICNN